MKNRDVRLGIITAAIYLLAVTAILSIIAWIGTELNTGGFVRYANAEYGVGAAIGLIISFACGYYYHTLLSNSISNYSNSNPDVPMKFVERICKSKLLTQYFGFTAVACLGAAVLIFTFTEETYIEALCLLMSVGFISLLLSLHYKFRSREIMRERFRSMPI